MTRPARNDGSSQESLARSSSTARQGSSAAASTLTKATSITSLASKPNQSVAVDAVFRMSTGLSADALPGHILQPGSSLKHRLPWLDGGELPYRMPGHYVESSSSPSLANSEHARSPLPKGRDGEFLMRDPIVRAVDSTTNLRQPAKPFQNPNASFLKSNDEREPESSPDVEEYARPTATERDDLESGDLSPTAIPRKPPQIPNRHPDHHHPTTRDMDRKESLNRAVTGLGKLMDDAVSVAEEASHLGRPEEASQILEEALQALRRASSVSNRHRTTLNKPLVISSESHSSSGLSDYEEQDVEAGPRMPRSRVGSVPRRASLHPGNHGDHHSHEADAGESVPGSSPRLQNQFLSPTVRDFAPRSESRAVEPGPHDGQKSRRDSFRRASIISPLNSSPELPAVTRRGHQSSVDDVIRVPPRASSRRRRSTVVAEPIPNPWAPKRHNTAIAEDFYDEKPRQRRVSTTMNLGAMEDDVRDRRREKRHFRNRDAETPGLDSKRKHSRSNTDASFGHRSRRQPVARRWATLRKRITATVACINTAFVGYVIGVYAGEVPRIQYSVVDPKHYIIQGNVYLFIGLAFSTFFCWPLPLLHGRKPYTLIAFATALPLQLPQAIVVSSVRSPSDALFRNGLLASRLFTGLVLGLANVNFITTLFDLFGVSLQSANPHQEVVMLDDVRRQGGGMGMWLGIWAWCFTSSMAIGFLTGAGIIAHIGPEWGFYITVIVGFFVLLLNVICPETRRSAYRRSFTQYVDDNEQVQRRMARGEVKLHLEAEGPMWWGEEVWAGIRLSFMMLFQRGFSIMAIYTGWTYAQVVLVIALLGSLLSRDYNFRPQYVGLGVMAIAVGALLAVPLTKASYFSRDRTRGPRTDSMTFERQVTMTSHMVRRLIFMLVLPLAGLAYTLTSPGASLHWSAPILSAGLIGFLSNLGIAECVGLIMETFDTSDLQPGSNSRHRVNSLESSVRRRRTNYSSFPRVTAGVFVSQSVGFLIAAAATGGGGAMTRRLSAQTATGVAAGVLLGVTILLILSLYRFVAVQVIPNHAFGTRKNSKASGAFNAEDDEYWKPVVIGNPSGKMRRMSLLELGHMSRWTEIRRLNRLIG